MTSFPARSWLSWTRHLVEGVSEPWGDEIAADRLERFVLVGSALAFLLTCRLGRGLGEEPPCRRVHALGLVFVLGVFGSCPPIARSARRHPPCEGFDRNDDDVEADRMEEVESMLCPGQLRVHDRAGG